MNDIVPGLATRDPIKLLMAETRFKPHVKKAVDEIDQLSEEDIDNLSLMLWQKQALKKIKLKKLEDARSEVATEAATRYADEMGDLSFETVFGKIMRYTGPDAEIKPIRGLIVTIRTGDYLFEADGIVWLGTIPLAPGLSTEEITHHASRVQYTTLIAQR